MAWVRTRSGCVFASCYFWEAGINELDAQRRHLSFPLVLSNLPPLFTSKVQLPRTVQTGSFPLSHNPPPPEKRGHASLCRCLHHCTHANISLMFPTFCIPSSPALPPRFLVCLWTCPPFRASRDASWVSSRGDALRCRHAPGVLPPSPAKETLHLIGPRRVTYSQAWGEGMGTPLGRGRKGESTGPRQQSQEMLGYCGSHRRASRWWERVRARPLAAPVAPPLVT